MTADLVFATLIALFPPKDDPEEWRRYATTAIAFEDAADHQMARGWGGSREDLEKAGLTAIKFESRMVKEVHEGLKRGGGKAVCPSQIHPTNGLFKHYADSLEDLAGTDYTATLACFQTMFRTLASGRAYCSARKWFTNWSPAMWRMYASGQFCQPTAHSWKRANFQASIILQTESDGHMRELVKWAREDES